MTNLTTAEQVFIERMRPHIDAGMSMEQAAAAVCERDLMIYSAATDTRTGPEVRQALAQQVYNQIRGT